MAVADQANQYANAIYNPQQDAIMRRIQLINDQTGARNNSLANVYGPQARQNVGGAYDTLDSMLGTNKTNAMSALNTQANQIGQGYRDAAELGVQMRDQSRNALAGLAQQIGAHGANYAMPGISELEASANQMIEANRGRDQNITANLRNWAGQAGSIYDQQIGTGHQMRASSLGDLEREIMQAIGENNLSGAEQQTDMGDQLTQLLGERGKYLAGLIQEMQAQEFERSFKQAQLDMQGQELNARMADSAADRSLRERAMAQEGQLSEKEKLQLQMQGWGMNRDALESDRNFGLEQSKFAREGQLGISDKINLASLLNQANVNPVTGENMGNDALLNSLYDLGVMERPPRSLGQAMSARSRLGGGFRRTGGSSPSSPSGRGNATGTIAGLRNRYNSLGG